MAAIEASQHWNDIAVIGSQKFRLSLSCLNLPDRICRRMSLDGRKPVDKIMTESGRTGDLMRP